MKKTPPHIITIVGKSNSGKTTLIEKLISGLTGRGYRVGSVKHTHEGFDMDKTGSDSWRHKQAGALATLVIAPYRVVLIKDDDEAIYLEQMNRYLGDMDIILAEGFKSADLAKIEIFRKDSGHAHPIDLNHKRLIAFVTDTDLTAPHAPTFPLEAADDITTLIENTFLKKKSDDPAFCA